MKSAERAAAWPEGAPSFAQLSEFFNQLKSGRITRERLRSWCSCRDRDARMIDHVEAVIVGIKLGIVEAEDLQRLLESPGMFSVFMTITLGQIKSARGYYTAMEKAGCKIVGLVNPLGALEKITVASEPIVLDLVVVSVNDLDLSDGARRGDVYAKALYLGLKLCPSEVGPALRLAYTTQPNEQSLHIGMEPVGGNTYKVDHNELGYWLDLGHPGNSDFELAGTEEIVFVQPRK